MLMITILLIIIFIILSMRCSSTLKANINYLSLHFLYFSFFIFHFLFYVLYFILSTINFICVRTIQILHSVSTGEDDVSLVAFIYRNSYSFVSKCTSPSTLNNGKLAFIVLKFFNTENIFFSLLCLFVYLFIYLFICLFDYIYL